MLDIISKLIGVIAFLVLLGTIGAGDFGNLQIAQAFISLAILVICMLLGGAFQPLEDSKK